MAAEWWYQNNNTQNMLKGVEGDEDNPPRLPDDVIIGFFRKIQEARDSYQRLRPHLLEEEQERIDALLSSAGAIDPGRQAKEDAFQSSWNKAGIHTAGRYGGQRRGGNR